MEAATGEDSEAGLERAEVVLLEADFAASTALDMVMVWGGGVEMGAGCLVREGEEDDEREEGSERAV